MWPRNSFPDKLLILQRGPYAQLPRPAASVEEKSSISLVCYGKSRYQKLIFHHKEILSEVRLLHLNDPHSLGTYIPGAGSYCWPRKLFPTERCQGHCRHFTQGGFIQYQWLLSAALCQLGFLLILTQKVGTGLKEVPRMLALPGQCLCTALSYTTCLFTVDRTILGVYLIKVEESPMGTWNLYVCIILGEGNSPLGLEGRRLWR